jgi:hypothetical protein
LRLSDLQRLLRHSRLLILLHRLLHWRLLRPSILWRRSDLQHLLRHSRLLILLNRLLHWRLLLLSIRLRRSDLQRLLLLLVQSNLLLLARRLLPAPRLVQDRRMDPMVLQFLWRLVRRSDRDRRMVLMDLLLRLRLVHLSRPLHLLARKVNL